MLDQTVHEGRPYGQPIGTASGFSMTPIVANSRLYWDPGTPSSMHSKFWRSCSPACCAQGHGIRTARTVGGNLHDQGLLHVTHSIIQGSKPITYTICHGMIYNMPWPYGIHIPWRAHGGLGMAMAMWPCQGRIAMADNFKFICMDLL